MNKPLIDQELLRRVDKILFVTHFAIGDFLYWQTYLRAFNEQYPHIKIHIWVDELRRTWKWWKWKPLSRYSLYDWLEACPFISKIYKKNYSLPGFFSSLLTARSEQYELVVSLAFLRAHRYALLTRLISPKGFLVGIESKKKSILNFLPSFIPSLFYRQLSKKCSLKDIPVPKNYHITDVYAGIFEFFFGTVVCEEKKQPFLIIPRDWKTNAKLTLLKWGIVGAANGGNHRPKIIFINIFAKDKKRCWSSDAVVKLITFFENSGRFSDAYFILNVVPEERVCLKEALLEVGLARVILFSAHEHFFQLPAIIELCDLVISVETAVMHIASALRVPVVALMRTKNPEWVPWDKSRSKIIMAARRTDWVEDITPKCVFDEVTTFFRVIDSKEL